MVNVDGWMWWMMVHDSLEWSYFLVIVDHGEIQLLMLRRVAVISCNIVMQISTSVGQEFAQITVPALFMLDMFIPGLCS